MTFPGSGPFGITSMSPATVDVAGGTLVTITGTALPANPRVRVGDSASAVVVSSSATSVVFRAPARVAGAYDVHVFATDGTTAVLTAALTYVDGAGAGSPAPAPPGTGTGTGGSGTGTAPTAPTAPEAPVPADRARAVPVRAARAPARAGPAAPRVRSSRPARAGSDSCGRPSSPHWAGSGR